jgi:hypothetical protein
LIEQQLARTEPGEASGVSLPVLAGAAVLATIVGRGIAPGIRGLAVGIEPFIALSDGVSAFISQLVAAGGVAAAIRLASGALRLPKLDLGYRLIGLPGSAIVIALVMAAWARPLEPELCRMMALAAIAAALAGAVASLRSHETRASGLVLGSTALSGFAHLMARELVSRAAERMDSSSLHWAVAVATLATLFDLAALGLTVTYLAQGKVRSLVRTAAIVIVPAAALGLFAARGNAPGASVLRVLAGRALSHLSLAPAAALPVALRFAISAALLIAAGRCVVGRGERGKASVVLSLCLLSLGAPDMPLPALWLVVAALLAPKHALVDAAPQSEQRVVGRST